MGKLRLGVEGVSFVAPGESTGAWIRINDGQDMGPVAIMIHPGKRGGDHNGTVVGGKGKVMVERFYKEVDDKGVTYAVDYKNVSDIFVVPNIEIAWSDT